MREPGVESEPNRRQAFALNRVRVRSAWYAGPGANFHTFDMNVETLLVECRACNRRAALTKADGLPIWQGNMTEVRAKRLKCRCGCAEVRRYIPKANRF